MSEHGLAPTEWGGQTEVVKTSATTGQGVNDLLEALDYVAELLDLKADDTIPATGWVVEAKMSSQEGPVATVLIKEGRLEKGDVLLAGNAYGRVRTMTDSYGKKVKVATSSMPVEVAGLNDVPQAGDRFYCLDDINKAKAAAEENKLRAREKSLAERTQVTMENLFSQIEAGNVKELNLIIRADVQGSVDVLKKYLSELSTSEVRLNILQAMPGGITEGDVLLAEASNAIIIGFNVVADEHAKADGRSRGRRYPAVQHHLSHHGRSAEIDGRSAGAGRAGAGARPGHRPGHLQGLPGRHGRRLLRHQRGGGQERQGAADSQQYRGPGQRGRRVAETLQGRCTRGQSRVGVRRQAGRL